MSLAAISNVNIRNPSLTEGLPPNRFDIKFSTHHGSAIGLLEFEIFKTAVLHFRYLKELHGWQDAIGENVPKNYFHKIVWIWEALFCETMNSHKKLPTRTITLSSSQKGGDGTLVPDGDQ